MSACIVCGVAQGRGRVRAEDGDWDAPITYRVKYEAHDGEPLGDHDAFSCRVAAFRHFRAVIADPDDPDLGSVYVTEEDGDEHVIAAHTFAAGDERHIPEATP